MRGYLAFAIILSLWIYGIYLFLTDGGKHLVDWSHVGLKLRRGFSLRNMRRAVLMKRQQKEKATREGTLTKVKGEKASKRNETLYSRELSELHGKGEI